MPNTRPGVVSVVLVNYRGATDTIEAIRHLRLVNWPKDRLEIIVVENASDDDSAERIRAAAPEATVIESARNLGFAGGCNLGVTKSSGEFVAFLNNDAKPHPDWISAAVARFGSGLRVGAVASRVLDWAGERIDFAGAGLTWFGMGYKPLTGEPISGEDDSSRDVLFGTGSAMFVRREVFDDLNGFDERFFMFFEDVDFGWRLNLRGWRFVYEPGSLAFHKHHASMEDFGSFREQYLLERNALFTLYKNLDRERLDHALPAALALSIRRGVSKGALDSSSLELHAPGDDSEMMALVSKQTMASVYAIDQFVENLDALVEDRDKVQSGRVVSDSRIAKLFGNTDMPAYGHPAYLRGYESISAAFGTVGHAVPTRVVVITGDPIGVKLAGPAIRAWNMADLLSRQHEVKLVTLAGAEPVDSQFEIVHVAPGANRAFDKLEEWADVIIFQGHAMAVFEALRRTKKIVVVDIYDPMHLEQLEQGRELGVALWEKQVSDATDVLNEQLARGDFFLCASERQKHFYLGQLAALGRINPANYTDDPDLNGLLAIAPFGLDPIPPEHRRNVLKSVVPGIASDDKVLLWSGGLYNWFDPKTLIRAVARLNETKPGVRLFFQGTKHPHPGVPEMAIVGESRQLAKELGVLESSVFFNSSWVDFADRQNYLTEADAGVSTHYSHIETTFSFRTRILDYLWAELPMVVTEGDHFAELIERERLGIVVPAEDVDALSRALDKILFDEDFIRATKANIARVRSRFEWERALAPLVDFVADPRHAADNRALMASGSKDLRTRVRSAPRRRSGIQHDLRQSIHYLRNGGTRVVISKIRKRLRRS